MPDTTIWHLAAFVEERIAEDERLARAASRGPWGGLNGVQITGPDGLEIATASSRTGPSHAATTAHIARHHPDRVLADSAAKRALVDLCLHAVANPNPDGPDASGPLAWATLCSLASPYTHHPDYHEHWQPHRSLPTRGVHDAAASWADPTDCPTS